MVDRACNGLLSPSRAVCCPAKCGACHDNPLNCSLLPECCETLILQNGTAGCSHSKHTFAPCVMVQKGAALLSIRGRLYLPSSPRSGKCTANATTVPVGNFGAPHAAAFTGDAVIVEPRRLARLPHVIWNFRTQLPSSWTVHFWHSHDNSDYVRAMLPLAMAIKDGTLRLTPMPSPTHGSNGRKWYNSFVKTRDFWQAFSAPVLMLFEADSVLCPNPTIPLASFVGTYAYVGAPWSLTGFSAGRHWCGETGKLPCCVGNSGLSLWDRKLIVSLLKANLIPTDGIPPLMLIDLWFSYHLQELAVLGKLPGIVPVPSPTTAAQFALSSTLSYFRGQTPIGLHNFRGSAAQEHKLLRVCPTAAILMNRSGTLMV